LEGEQVMREYVFQDEYIQVGNVNTRYWEAGNRGSSVILLHGIGSFIEHWEYNYEALSKKHHVLAVDLVGFGLTEKPSAPYSIPYLTKFVEEFMWVKGIKSASIVGNSLGAMIAVELCLINPALVNKLVLVSGGCFGKRLAFELRLLTVPYVGEKLMRPNRDRTLQFLQLNFANQAVVSDEMVDLAFERNAQPGSGEAYLETLRSGANIFGLKQDLVDRTLDNASKIRTPTLVIWGKQDRILPIEHAYKAGGILPNADILVFDECGHMPQIECYEKVNEKILTFLAK